jgi:N-acetylglucosamine-6-phosphate deacetylase
MREILRQTRGFTLTPNLAGFRPEIMYLADASGGPAASLARPERALTEELWEASEGRIRIWDVSPELDGALPFISWCAQHGIVSSMAHSSAGIDRVREAVDAGLGLITHFYDLFPQPQEIDEGVYPAGVTDYINVEDRLTVELIPDGVHAHPLLVELSLRCKGADRVAFITDSLKGSGNPPGRYEGLIPGEPVEVTPDRGIRRISDGILSGSALTQIESFRNAVRKFGRTIAEASRLCSRTPARLLGLRDKGVIGPGKDADLLILDADLRIRTVILGGRVAKG